MPRMLPAGALFASLTFVLSGCNCDGGFEADRRLTLHVNAPAPDDQAEEEIDPEFARPPRARATPPPARAAPAEVTVSFTTEPAGAQLSFDGVIIGRAPLELTRPWSAKAHRIVATLDGHRPTERSFTLEREQQIELRLEPIAAPASVAVAPAAARPAAAAASAPALEDDEDDESDSYRLDDLKDPYAD